MPAPTSFAISHIDLWPVDLPITDPFVVATGARAVAENIFVRVTLESGAQGYGEIAPFPEVGGEDRPASLRAATDASKTLRGQSVAQWTRLAHVLREMIGGYPAARCGLETAILDTFCHAASMPLWALWGGADVRPRETDITIPISDQEKTVSLARGWHEKGFRLLKMKVGKDVENDVRRLEAVHRALPDIAFIGDGNQGYSREECLAFTNGVKRFGGRLVLLEQPLVRDDLEGLSALRHLTGIPMAADESVRSLNDAREVLKQNAADLINIKIMKTGIVEALEIAQFARASGLGLMIGGMVEARIAMGCSFAMVLGLGGFDVLDLDTPLLLGDDPVRGGYCYQGPWLQPWDGPGLDLAVDVSRNATTIE
ncbi:MAG: dipeptide epimerase [Nitrospira sp.]|nr:MAG: dipeptide epimerase [Nitrospira sp.]